MTVPGREVVEFALVALSSVFFIVDPIATVPTFLALTQDCDPAARRRTARDAAWTCFGVLSLFALAGTLIFQIFGITLPALKIAGGVLLFLLALEMLQSRRMPSKEVPAEAIAEKADDARGVIPLGFPMLAGPGALSTAMVLTGQSHNWWQSMSVYAAIAMTALASFLILSAADRVRYRLNASGIAIITRLMGLVLAAIAVQFVLNGLTDVGLIQKPR